MRKELLLSKKKDLLSSSVARVMTEEEIKSFSMPQLQMLCDILKRIEEFRENYNPFYSLSANEVLHKESGKIAYFDDFGKISEESEDEILSGACRFVYAKYKEKERKQL